MSSNDNLSVDDIEKLINDDHSFKVWTVQTITQTRRDVKDTRSDVQSIKKYLAPSTYVAIILAIGAMAEVLIRLTGH